MTCSDLVVVAAFVVAAVAFHLKRPPQHVRVFRSLQLRPEQLNSQPVHRFRMSIMILSDENIGAAAVPDCIEAVHDVR